MYTTIGRFFFIQNHLSIIDFRAKSQQISTIERFYCKNCVLQNQLGVENKNIRSKIY